MSTRSRIGFEFADGSILTCYCHHDGYIAGVGAALAKYYTNIDDVVSLVELGSFSSIMGNRSDSDDKYPVLMPNEIEADNEEIAEMNTIFFENRADAIYWLVDSDQEYLYIFSTEDEEWYAWKTLWNEDEDGCSKSLYHCGRVVDNEEFQEMAIC